MEWWSLTCFKKWRKYDRRFGWSISTRKEKYRHSKCTFEHDYIDKQQKKKLKKITILIVGIDHGCDSKLLFGESISQKFRNSSDLETGLTDYNPARLNYKLVSKGWRLYAVNKFNSISKATRFVNLAYITRVLTWIERLVHLISHSICYRITFNFNTRKHLAIQFSFTAFFSCL